MGCAQCGRRDFVLVSNRAEGLQDGEEIVTYDRAMGGTGEDEGPGSLEGVGELLGS